MYAIELTIGIILTIFGTLVVIYFAFFRIKKKNIPISFLYISEGAATLFIGIFYIICSAIIMKNKQPDLNEQPVQPINLSFYDTIRIHGGPSINNQEDLFHIDNFLNPANMSGLQFDDSQMNKTVEEFIVRYDLILKEFMNKTSKKQRKSRSINTETCDLQEIYLKYAMLISSFIYGLISVINSTIECEKCEIKPKERDTESISSAPSRDTQFFYRRALNNKDVAINTEIKMKTKYVLQIMLTWLIPIVYTIIAYFTMKNTSEEIILIKKYELKPSSSEMDNIIEAPINISNTSGQDIDLIVNKIYDIVSNMNTTEQESYEILNYSTRRAGRSNNYFGIDCDYKNMPLKLHTLILFIIGYFGVLFYAKNIHTKLELSRNDDENVSKLGKYILVFGVLWLPSIMEIFTRTYLMDYQPNITSDICLAIGNVSRIAANVINILVTHSVMKKHNNLVHNNDS